MTSHNPPSSPPSVLYLALDVDTGRRSGEATHVLEVVRALRDEGIGITLVLPETTANREIAHGLLSTGMEVCLASRRSTIARALWIRRHLSRKLPDVIYERNFAPKVGVVLSILLGVPLVVEVNAISPIDAQLYWGHPEPGGALARARRIWNSFLLSRPDAIVAVTAGIADALRSEYSLTTKRIEILPNGANTTLFRPQDQRTCRALLKLPEGGMIVCFVGDLAPWHGVDVLLESIADLAASGDQVSALLVGDGVMRESLQDFAKTMGIVDRVLWAGEVPYDMVPYYIGASDITVAPFANIPQKMRFGLSPLKVFEYMACGRPVITTQSVIDSQTDLEAGVITVTPGDPTALASAIRRLISDPVERRRLGVEGRMTIEANYSWERIGGRLGALLLSMRRP